MEKQTKVTLVLKVDLHGVMLRIKSHCCYHDKEKISDPWKEVPWDEAISFAAQSFKKIQDKYGKDSVGGITSSRCTNEETYLVQNLLEQHLVQIMLILVLEYVTD